MIEKVTRLENQFKVWQIFLSFPLTKNFVFCLKKISVKSLTISWEKRETKDGKLYFVGAHMKETRSQTTCNMLNITCHMEKETHKFSRLFRSIYDATDE